MTLHIAPSGLLRQMQLPPISQGVWNEKYRFTDPDGTPEASVAETWARVARACATAEKTPELQLLWERRFLKALTGFGFLPAGRILAGAGTGRNVTLFNCFVLGEIEDDLGSIFAHQREAALTLQQGGGIGHDFSSLRPKGALVKGVGADASGPVSFMECWDAMCRTIKSAGSRRGAMMGTLCCDHPDIEAFIAAKADPSKLRNFNVSVLVTDAFMDAVRYGKPWDLVFDGKVYATVDAKGLWQKIMRSAYETAEPGVIFIDRMNALNNLAYCETIRCTNPCGEQPLPPYGACLLGSINLAALVEAPFCEDAHIPSKVWDEIVPAAVRLLDNVIDISNFPLPAQRAEALAKRRIGIGVTGLADALVMCNAHYGASEGPRLASKWMHAIARQAYLASSELAVEKGSFPLYDRDRFPLHHVFLDDVREIIAERGLRNGLLTSIAPTGTISLLAGNVSSGIEPIFELEYKRRVLNADGSHRTEVVQDYAYRLWRELKGDEPLPATFVTAGKLNPDEHVAMQARLQVFVDASISKTVNCPAEMPFLEFEDLYQKAYANGLKGCAAFRPNEITGSVLIPLDPQTAPEPEPANVPAPPPAAVPPAMLPRDPILSGFTYKVKWPASDHAIYVTLNDTVDDAGQRRPYEMFINSKNLEHYAWTVALTRMISAIFRRGGDVSFVFDELKAVFDPRGGMWSNGAYVASVPALIGLTIEEHFRTTGLLSSPAKGEKV